jgi:hypothetical protein
MVIGDRLRALSEQKELLQGGMDRGNKPMKAMKKHVTGRQNIDYYECTQCGWSYPVFSGSIKLLKDTRPTEREGQREFEKHDCENFPRFRQAAN